MGYIKVTRLSRRGMDAWLLVVAMFCLCLTSTSAAAQDTLQDTATNVTVSEQEVYENPDDHELNLQYAKEQIRLGEMLNAGAALERMLYANPNWHSARLLYAAVLYRLDDQQAALRELSLLKDRELNPQQLETLSRYKADFEVALADTDLPVSGKTASYVGASSKPIKPVRGKLTLGLAADNNAGNAFADEAFGFGDRGDISAFIGGKVELFVPVTKNNATSLTAGVDFLTKHHNTFVQADYGVYDVHAGIRFNSGKGRVSADVVGRQLNINGEKYLTQIGPRVSFSQPVSTSTHVSFSASAFSQDYNDLDLAPREDERDGVKTSLQLGVYKKIDAARNILAAVSYETKSADLGAFAYQGPVVAAEFRQNFGSGQYFKTQFRARQLNFRAGQVNQTAETDKRKDTRITARGAIGIPLGETRHLKTKDAITLELGANYNRRDSNFTSNDYENFGADARLVVEF